MSGLSGFGHTVACGLAYLLSAVSLRDVFLDSADAHIADRIRPNVTIPCHHISTRTVPSLRPFATIGPDSQPFFKGEQEWDVAPLGAALVDDVAGPFRVIGIPFGAVAAHLIAVCLAPYAQFRILFFAVRWIGKPCALPCPLIRSQLRSAIIGISHRLCFSRTVVRGGAGAETPTSSRLYHALPQGAY